MMENNKSWQLGRPGTLLYKVFDRLRCQLNRRLVNTLHQKCIRAENNRVLEAGSGTANATSMFSKQPGVSLSVAVDIDAEALLESRLRDPHLPLVIADIHALPFVNGCFDLVWNSSTLEHLERQDLALREMRRVTRPGGSVFVGVPFAYGPLGFQRWVDGSSLGQWIGTVFNRMQLRTRLVQAGLEPVDYIHYFLYFFIGIRALK